jgi:hypothetical protein
MFNGPVCVQVGGGSVMVWSSICPDLKIVEGTRIGLTTRRIARSPDSLSLLRTVRPEIRTFVRPGVRTGSVLSGYHTIPEVKKA